MDKYYLQKLKNKEYDDELIKVGLIDSKGIKKSSLIKAFFEKNLVESIVANKNTDLLLTDQENKVYKKLCNSKGELVTRDDIAQVLWENKYIEKYSDEGIDSVISRIRKKIPEIEIKTLRKRGFILK